MRTSLMMAAMLVGLSATGATNTLQGNICIIDSYGREIAPFNATERAARDAILDVFGATTHTELQVFGLDDARYADAKRHERYAGALDEGVPKPVVLVAAIGETAARFSSKYRARLFPDATIVFVADAAGLSADGIVTTNDVVVPLAQDPSIGIENVLTVLPHTTNIAVVIGNSDLEKKWLKKCRTSFASFTNRIGFTYLNKAGLKAITNAVANLPPRSAVLYMMLINDGEGLVHDYDDTLKVIHDAANAPVFGCFESQFGSGIVGGKLLQNRAAGLAAGDAVVRLFLREQPGNIVPPSLEPGPSVYDERELRRWGISERSLPSGSRVEFRGPGIWAQYRTEVIVSLAIIAMQTLLIIALLIHRRRLRAAQSEIRENQRHASLAARAAKMGFWYWETDRTTMWASPSCRKLFGLSDDEVLDVERFFNAVHPDDRATRRRTVHRALECGGEYESEFRVVHPDGSMRWIGSRGKAETDGTGKPARISGVSMDITERKHIEMEADALRQELAHISRVSTMGELAASMAHELNQPLAAILSNAQAARRFLASSETDLDEIRAILDDIVRDDKRAGEVIHRLRALVQKRESAIPEPVDVNDLVHDTGRLLHSELVSRNIELDLRTAAQLPLAIAGRVEIQQVLLNLVVNAMDAMADLTETLRQITIETSSANDTIRVSVRDSGPGIPDHVMPDIFRPFFSTKPHGLGMGLAICRSMVEASRGRLWVENHPDGGAVFLFELPRA